VCPKDPALVRFLVIKKKNDYEFRIVKWWFHDSNVHGSCEVLDPLPHCTIFLANKLGLLSALYLVEEFTQAKVSQIFSFFMIALK
jgi:hypothetical protein